MGKESSFPIVQIYYLTKNVMTNNLNHHQSCDIRKYQQEEPYSQGVQWQIELLDIRTAR